MEIEGLSVVCAGLGCASQDADGKRNEYIKSENCLENLKDLQRFLRRDHPQTRDVFKQLGKWNTVSQDLIPIIEQYRNETELVMNTVKVIVFLTMPIDPSSDDISLQMEYLWSFKASFSCNDAIAVIVSLLEEPLEHLECESFTEDDWKVIQLVLTLFRNLLAIRDPSPQQMTGRSNSQTQFLRDGFLEHLFHENVMDLLLALTQHVAGSHGFLKQDNLLLLEIFHFIFLGQQPELVATVQQKILKSDTKQHRLSGTLRSMMEEEEEQRRLLRLRDLPRHSQFCGTFVRLAPDGSKRIVKRNPFITPAESILKTCQIKRGPIKRIACDTSSPVSSKNSVLGLLQHFADQFLDSGYNVLMQSVREDIRKEHPSIQTSDIIVFFEVAHFFTAYQRCRVSNCKAKTGSAEVNECNKDVHDTVYQGLICAPIASTMNEPIFNMVISKWHYAFETLKETHDLKSLTTAGALIKEMIHILDLVLRVSRNGSREREHEARTARILLYKVFYDQTENGISVFLRTLIKSFDYHKQPRSYLADLVEITHIMLRLMEALKEADGTLRVLRKTQKGRKKKKMDDSQLDPVQSGDNNGLQDATEDASKMKDYHDNVTDGTVEFDKEKDNSDVQTDDAEQGDRLFKDDRDRKVQHKSSLNNADECEEEEIECMEENCDDRSENLPDDTEDISEDDNHAGRIEANFDIAKYISSFADNTIIQNYCWLLKFYKTNSPATNHYIIRMLQRICDDCMLSPMLYQLSLFCTFYEILSDQKTLQSDRYKSIVEFLTKLLRTFFKKMKNQPFLLLEILFWKTRRECNFISTDHLLSEMNKLRKGNSSKEGGLAGALGDDEADGTNTGKSTVGSYKRNLAEALGDDEAGLPLDELDHHEKKTLGKEWNRRSPKKRKSLIFNDEQEAQIKELFEQYKGNRRCSHMIAEALHSDGKISAVQVSRKLKQLGLKVGSNKQKSRVVELFNDEDDETAEEVEDGVLDKPLSVGIHGKTGRKRQILDSEDDSEDATQQTDLLKKTSRKRQFLDSENESEDETNQNDQLKISERKKSVLKHKKKSPKNGKSFVPSEEQDSLLKELFEQHKENRKCSHLIAESVGLTVAQVNQRLKLLGLKVTSRKRESGIVKNSSEKATSRKQKSGVVKLYDDEEFRNCSCLIAEAIGLPVAQVKRKLKMLSFKAISRKSKSGVKDSTNKDDEATVGVADADDSDNEPLITKLLESQNMKIQKGNTAEACNKPVKESGVDEHLSGKDDEIAVGQGDDDEIRKCSRLISEAVGLPVTQVERKLKMLSVKVASRKSNSGVKQSTNKDDKAAVGVAEADDSDDEPLITKLEKSQNMRIQEENKSGVDEQLCDKDYKNTQGVGDGDNLDDEILMTRLLKVFEKNKSLVKDKNNKSPRRRKSFPSSGEQDGLIKDLFKQHKENVKCSTLIAEAVGLSVAQVKRKLKMLGLSVTSRKAKSRVFENFTDKNDKSAVGVEDEDTSDDEPLAAKFFKGQHMKVQKAKTTEACNEPGKKSAVAEHVSDKDVETAAGVGDKADSDDEPLMTKLLIAQNIKGHKTRTIEACSESVKKSGAARHVGDNNDDNAAGLGGQDDSDDEALVMRLLKSKDTTLETTDANRKIDNIKELDDELDDELLKGHLVKSRLEKLSSTKIGKAGGFNNTNRSQVNLGDLSDLKTGTSLRSMADSTPSGKSYDVTDSILATENGVRDTNALPQDKKHSRKENWRALSVEDDSLYKSYKKMEDESMVLEDNVQMDIEENIPKGDNNDNTSAKEYGTETFEGKTMFSRGKRKMHMITEDDD